MKSSIDKSEKKENAKINQNEEISEVSDENSENIDQEDPVLKINYDSFITTPYERVLAIINDAKAFILSITKEQQELVKGLEWAIKVISSHSLYSYELKDQDYLNQVSEENPDFKQFVEFVNSYNDEVIQMNKKIYIIGGGKSALNSKRVNVPSSSHMKKEEEKKVEEKPKEKDKEKEQKVLSSNNDINIKEKPKTKQKIESKIKSPKGRTHMLLKNKNKSFNKFTNKEKNSKNINSKPIKLINKKNIINKSNNNLINNNQIK